MKKKERVIAAMSGGVDSSVAATLLLEQGYDVVGATLVFKPCGEDGEVSWCCGRGAVESARSVCQTLGIKHYSFDCPSEFAQHVLEPSWNEYRSGRTPIPCVLCNQEMKFGFLLDKAKSLGATKVATGHYARTIFENGIPSLYRGKDPAKDQSYFLFSLDDNQLASTVFPLGDISKDKVREMARNLGLSSAERPDSQDACFVLADGSFSSALAKRFGNTPSSGVVVDKTGTQIGKHSGVHLYTVGQRKGLRIALGKKAYVSDIDAKDAKITLSDNPDDLLSKGLVASNVMFNGSVNASTLDRCEAQIRYKHQAVFCQVSNIEDNRIKIIFDTPQRSVAPGQAVVLYQKDRLLGGGWIESAI